MDTASELLVASRRDMQREFDSYQAAAGEQVSYGSGVAKWLAGQLPGADMTRVGWGIVLVTAMLYPTLPVAPAEEKAHPGRRWGQRFTLILASRVGEALLEAAFPAEPSGRPFEVGPELARFDMSTVYTEMTGLPSSSMPGADPALLRQEFYQVMGEGLADIRQTLASELPGADLPAIGWGLIGTGSCLLMQTAQIEVPRRLRPGARRRRSRRASAMNGALFLASIGDYLTGPAPDRTGA